MMFTLKIKQLINYILLISLIILFSGCVFFEDEGEQDNQLIYYDDNLIMSNGLTLEEAKIYVSYYNIGYNELLYPYDPTKEFEFFIKDSTGWMIAVYNYMFWDYVSDDEDYNERLENARSVCAEYGFTSENRLTCEWTLDNPKEALELAKEIPIMKKMSYDYLKLYEEHIGPIEHD